MIFLFVMQNKRIKTGQSDNISRSFSSWYFAFFRFLLLTFHSSESNTFKSLLNFSIIKLVSSVAVSRCLWMTFLAAAASPRETSSKYDFTRVFMNFLSQGEAESS